MDQKKPIIITLASLKGGVGKSSLSILFSYVLKELGKKVLLIDLDPQNSLSSYFNRYITNIKKHNVYEFLKGNTYFDKCENKINEFISIIPSHPVLEKFNTDDIDYKEIILEFRLNKSSKSFDFDYIIIDTSPSKNFLLKNALNVTDHVIIPVQVERWSIESFSILKETINNIQNIKNKEYNISIIENQFIKNRNTLKEVEDVLYKKYGKYIKGKIHFSNSIKVFINDLLEPSLKEIYYREAENALKNIL
ncbi:MULTISPECIES: ParA family protein [Borreliella]|uniref:ParA family protein n=1 Tax=Borreliella TaxID=64895 RepID=UPI001AEF4E9E|nr:MULTISPECIES: ParA family protein [Borreliella]WLN25912.1 ParA family protein [Borreliella valaisiana]